MGIFDWIFSKLRASLLKGMVRSKDGEKMGGQEQKNFNAKDKALSSIVIIGNNIGVGHGPTMLGIEDDVAAPAQDEPSSPGYGGCSGSSGGSSSCISGASSPSGTPPSTQKKRRTRKLVGNGGSKRHKGPGSTESDDSEASSTLEREAPDGGWGWVVVGAAFFVNLLADGVTLSYGSFLKSFSDMYGSSKFTTSFVGSLLSSMPLLSGPIASTFTDRYGCRKVTIFGAILSCFGCALSYYANSIQMLMLSFIVIGLGLSLCYVAAVVIVAYYFERKRSFATGLSACGGGIGTFILSPFTSFCIGKFGARITMLILAGLFLTLCVCGLLMKDLEWTKKSSRKKEKLLQNEQDFNNQALLNAIVYGDCPMQEGNALMGFKSKRLCNSAVCIPTFVQEQEKQKQRQRTRSPRVRYYSNNYGIDPTKNDLKSPQIKPNKFPATTPSNDQAQMTQTEIKTDKDNKLVNGEDHPLNGLLNSPGPGFVESATKLTMSNNDPFSKQLQLAPTSLYKHTQSLKTYSNNASVNDYNENYCSPYSASVNNRSNTNIDEQLISEKTNVTEDEYPDTLINIQEQKQQAMRNYVVHHTKNSQKHRYSLTYRGAVLSIKRYQLRPASSCPDIISVATDDRTSEWRAALTDVYVWMKGVFAIEHFSNTRFLLFVISNFLLYTWYDIPYYFLSGSATELGYSEMEGAMFGSVIGIFNVFGNIIVGYIGDRKWADSVTVYGVCISVCGAVTVLMPIFFTRNPSDYYTLCGLCGIFGIMIAANYSLTPVILVQVVSLERFTNAYGLLLLIQGIGNLMGPPIAGLLFDITGTWKWSFYVAGGGILLSNVFILAPIYKKYEDSDKSTNTSRSASVNKGESEAEVS